MGYLSNGKYVTVHSSATRIEQEIMEEIKVQYRHRFGYLFTEDRFNQLSSTEQEWVIHQAGVTVQDRHRRRML